MSVPEFFRKIAPPEANKSSSEFSEFASAKFPENVVSEEDEISISPLKIAIAPPCAVVPEAKFSEKIVVPESAKFVEFSTKIAPPCALVPEAKFPEKFSVSAEISALVPERKIAPPLAVPALAEAKFSEKFSVPAAFSKENSGAKIAIAPPFAKEFSPLAEAKFPEKSVVSAEVKIALEASSEAKIAPPCAVVPAAEVSAEFSEKISVPEAFSSENSPPKIAIAPPAASGASSVSDSISPSSSYSISVEISPLADAEFFENSKLPEAEKFASVPETKIAPP